MKLESLQNNPFLTDPNAPVVHVAKGDDPYTTTRDALTRLDLSPARGKKVLLKPNAGRIASMGEGITTHPQVVAAAIDAFLEAGAVVSVGESPITGIAAEEALEATGIAAVARERGCTLIDMDVRPFVDVEVPGGTVLKAIKVCSDVFDHDSIVSIPVMKIHMHTDVTLAVKNMKGCLWRRSKVELHMMPTIEGIDEKPLNIAIADLAGVLLPHLSIIDGIVGMEGMGPSAGTAKALGVVVVGAEPLAADAVACRLMGTSAEKVPHLRMAGERGYGIIDEKRITVTPDNWLDWSSSFAPPPSNLSIEFPEFDIVDKNSCSACQSTLLLFLQQYGNAILDYFPPNTRVTLAIGKGHENVPENAICIGNCMARHRAEATFVTGCPPIGSEILKAITGKTTLDGIKVKL